MKKKYLLYVMLPVMAFALVGGVMSASAASTTNNVNPMSNLVAAIAQKFNLNARDVQKVFDDQKSQMQAIAKAHMEQTFTDAINKAVSGGKLTQDQANKIIAKKAELQAQRETFKTTLEGKTKEEVKVAMKTQMDTLKQWATDNNVPLQYLRFGMGGKFNMHRGGL